MKVRIIGCRSEGYWYKKYLGCIFEVDEQLEIRGGIPMYQVIKGERMGSGIEMKDCEIIEEPKEIPIKQFHSVQNPQHYHSGGIDPIGYAELNFPPEQLKGFYRINVLKYLSRYDQKNGIEDLEKADEYLKMLIDCERANREGRKENV